MSLNEVKIKIRVDDLLNGAETYAAGVEFDGTVEMIAPMRDSIVDASHHCESCDNNAALVFVSVTPNIPMDELTTCLNCLILGDDLISIEGAWSR